MGNWNINIQGSGCHHNNADAKDADVMAADFVLGLRSAGHTVESATITYGSKEDITHGKGRCETPPASTVGLAPLVAGLLFLTFGAVAAEPNAAKLMPPPAVAAPPAKAEHAAGEFALAAFGTYRMAEAKALNDEFGGGLEFSYFLKDNVALSLEALTDDAVDEAGVNLKRFVPLHKFPVVPYGLIGVSRSFQSDDETVLRRGDWRFNLGLGIEYRVTKRFALFGDARWTHDFDELEHGFVRFGGNLRF